MADEKDKQQGQGSERNPQTGQGGQQDQAFLVERPLSLVDQRAYVEGSVRQIRRSTFGKLFHTLTPQK